MNSSPAFTLTKILVVASAALVLLRVAHQFVILFAARHSFDASRQAALRNRTARKQLLLPIFVVVLASGARSLVEQESFALATIGSALYVIAFQLTLWQLGIRSELFGTNVTLDEDPYRIRAGADLPPDYHELDAEPASDRYGA
jgi:hypothetical protein